MVDKRKFKKIGDALDQVYHDDTLLGKGTSDDPLKLSPIGFKAIDENSDKAYFLLIAEKSLSTSFNGTAEGLLSDLVGAEELPSLGDKITDANGYMAVVTNRDVGAQTWYATTFYRPPNSSDLVWDDISGNVRDNASYVTVMGDKEELSSFGATNYVDAVNIIQNMIKLPGEV